MKQTASVNNNGLRAVAPRIRNAGRLPVFIAVSANIEPHYAARNGTNHAQNA